MRKATAEGVTNNRLLARDLDRSVWGVRDPNTSTDLWARCTRFAARLDKDVVFSHSTAGLLFGAPLPLQLEKDTSLNVSVRAPARAPHADGLKGHALALHDDEVATRSGLRTTSAARTWCDLASQLDLLNLVAAGDHLINRGAPATTVSQLELCLDRHPLLRGSALARQALGYLDGAAESRPESMVRVILSLGSLPALTVNRSLVVTVNGSFVRPDFEFTQYKTIVEYQGDYHRTPAQWRKDMTRRSRLEAAGWTVIEINADDLKDLNELIERVAISLRRHGWTGRTKRVFAQIRW